MSFYDSALRHFIDLRDGTHGGLKSRDEKESIFSQEIEIIDPVVRKVLTEVNSSFLLGQGSVNTIDELLQEDKKFIWEYIFF